MPNNFRQLDRGTVCVHSLPVPSSRSSSDLHLLRDHTSDDTLVGYAMCRAVAGHMVETWVLFSNYKPPALNEAGEGTGFEVHAVPPSKIVPDFVSRPGHELPSLEAFVEGALAGRTDRERCTVMQATIKILDKDDLPPG